MAYANLAERREYSRKYAKTRRGKRLRRISFKKRSMERDKLIHELKAKPCTDCGQCFPPECMDFDHVRGIKLLEISKRRFMKLDKVLKEIAKCELVCANCHRIRTRKRREEKQK